jgi:RNase H-like domain found in reverse transcriptase
LLAQNQPDGESRVVQHASRTLNAVGQRYSNTERELLAIVSAVTKKLRFHSEYKSFAVYTDHKALIEKTTPTEDSKRTVRLWLKVAEFDRAINHKGGAEMAAPDAVSRHVARAAMTDVHSTEIMECLVELGHRSWKQTYEGFNPSRSLQGMWEEIWRVVRACSTCIRYNMVTTKIGNRIALIETTAPKQMLHTDNWGPLERSSGNS